MRKQEQEEFKSRAFSNQNAISPRKSLMSSHIPEEEPFSEIQPQSSIAADTVIENDATFDSIEKYCDDLFREAPIVFKPRRGNKLDEQI